MMAAKAAKLRPRSELIMRLIQPLATAGVQVLARWHINPLWIVTTHALLGFIAAGLLAAQQPALWLGAAILLQLKTLLDNMDGGLARATNQVTRMGRYFDTGMDTLVNLSLFIALGLYGSLAVALVAFMVQMLLLSADFNAERLYRDARQRPQPTKPLAPDPIGAPIVLYSLFKGFYEFLLKPQDALIRRADAWLFKLAAARTYENAPLKWRLRWSDLYSTATLVNLGLSTQLAVLGACLLLGKPYWYVYSIFYEGVYVLLIQLSRIYRFKRNHPS